MLTSFLRWTPDHRTIRSLMWMSYCSIALLGYTENAFWYWIKKPGLRIEDLKHMSRLKVAGWLRDLIASWIKVCRVRAICVIACSMQGKARAVYLFFPQYGPRFNCGLWGHDSNHNERELSIWVKWNPYIRGRLRMFLWKGIMISLGTYWLLHAGGCASGRSSPGGGESGRKGR